MLFKGGGVRCEVLSVSPRQLYLLLGTHLGTKVGTVGTEGPSGPSGLPRHLWRHGISAWDEAEGPL